MYIIYSAGHGELNLLRKGSLREKLIMLPCDQNNYGASVYGNGTFGTDTVMRCPVIYMMFVHCIYFCTFCPP